MSAQAQAIAERCRKSKEPVHALCRVYGIKLKSICDPSIEGAEDYHRGPVGGGIDPIRRIAYIKAQTSGERTAYYLEHYEQLHEVAHVISAIPFCGDDGIAAVPEEWLLFALETALAKAILDKTQQSRSEEWQHNTSTSMKSARCLDWGELEAKERYRFMSAARKRGRQLGILDEKNEPTFRWPRWEAMSLRQIQSMLRSTLR